MPSSLPQQRLGGAAWVGAKVGSRWMST
jgi:hypothetical protein